jgi:hypothetical protein
MRKNLGIKKAGLFGFIVVIAIQSSSINLQVPKKTANTFGTCIVRKEIYSSGQSELKEGAVKYFKQEDNSAGMISEDQISLANLYQNWCRKKIQA